MSSADVTLIQSLYAAFGRGDIAPIIAALSPDVNWRVNDRREDYALLGARKGPREVEEFFATIPQLHEFTEFSPKEFHASENKVFVLGRYAAKVRKTGRSVACDWMHVFTMRDGKIAAFLEFTDTAQWAQAAA
jgi:hypothetical protein